MALTMLTPSFSQPQRGEFAIIADSHSMKTAGDEIRQYAGVLQSEGLDAVVIEDRWRQPDSIRMLLHDMYVSNKGFEGAVFIGDIPVPMLRDAQHLSSAFKMIRRDTRGTGLQYLQTASMRILTWSSPFSGQTPTGSISTTALTRGRHRCLHLISTAAAYASPVTATDQS